MIDDDITIRGEDDAPLSAAAPNERPREIMITVTEPGMGEMADGRIVDEVAEVTLSAGDAAKLGRFLLAHSAHGSRLRFARDSGEPGDMGCPECGSRLMVEGGDEG